MVFLYGRAGDGIQRAEVSGRVVRQKEERKDLVIGEKHIKKERRKEDEETDRIFQG